MNLTQMVAALWGCLFKIARIPLTLSLSTSAAVLALLQAVFSEQYISVLEWLCFDYTAIVNHGEFWRMLTGHWVHSSAAHAFWDIALFFLLAAYLELKNPRFLLLGVSLAMLCISIFMLTPIVKLERYSGLSGIIYTLLVLAYWQWQKDQDSLIGVIPAILVFAKTILEWQTESAVFVSDGWQVFPESHLLGAAIGGGLILYLKYKHKLKGRPKTT